VLANWSCDDPTSSVAVNDLPADYFVINSWARSVVPDQAGGIYVSWAENTSDLSGRCRVQHLDAEGNRLWGNEGLKLVDMDGEYYPGLLADPAGGVYAWVSSSPTPEPNFEVRMQRFGPNGTRLWGNFGKVVYQACGVSAYRPAIVPDGVGGFFLTLMTTPVPQQVRIQHISADGQLLWGGGSTCGIAAVTTTESVFNAGVVADGTGGLFLSYDEYAGNGTGGLNVRAERLDANGNPLWGTGNGIMVCNQLNDQFSTAPLLDDQGGVLVFWYARHTIDGWDYVGGQRLDANGTPIWSPNGSQVLPVGNYLTGVIADGAGGAWVSTWRWGSDRDNYLQRVNRNGQPVFADFIPVCVAPERQYGAGLVDDRAGGCYAVWSDWRNGGWPNQDLYFQHFGPSGQIYEPIDGAPITTDPDRQGDGWALTSDESGRGWVAWDYDSPFEGIHAERLPCSIPTLVDDQAPTPSASIIAVPNPFVPHHGSVQIRLGDNHLQPNNDVGIFDASGRQRRHLFAVDGGAGGTLLWDGTDDTGALVPSGVYLIRTTTAAGPRSGAVIVTR